jgi:hypothetical protein
MADTQRARISVGVVDQLGTRATIPLYALIDPASLVSDVAASVAATATVLKAVLGAAITDVNVTLEFPEVDAADAGSRVEQTAVLDYNVPASGRQAGIALAGWLDGLVGPGGAPMISGAAGAAAVAGLTGALPPTILGIWTNSAYQPLGGLNDAFLSFRKRRKSLSRSSEEPAP